MRHACKECGASYRNPHDLDEHKRVGCRVEPGQGESLIAEEVEVEQEVSPEPEPQEKESSQWQEPT